MQIPKASSPFKFVTQVNLTQITNAHASTLAELLDQLRSVSGSVIYHHTHRFLKQHQFLSPEPPNDFAYWVNTSLHDELLSEKLAAIDTIRYSTIRKLREKIIYTIEQYILEGRSNPKTKGHSDFHFMQTISFVLPTTYEANDIKEFSEALMKISINSIYHHIFEARIRQFSGMNDISYWLRTSLDEQLLADTISKMDPYTQTLEGLRKRIIKLIDKRVQEIESA